MHISFFLSDLHGGGAQKMIINMANEFAFRGHSTDLVLVNDKGAYKDLIESNVNVINFNKSRTIYSLFDHISYIKTQQPDISLSALFHVNILNLISQFFVKKSVSTQFLISERNLFSIRTRNSDKWIDKYIIPSLVKFFYKRADKVIAISGGVRNDIISSAKLRPENVTCIYNPVVTKTMVNLTSDLKETESTEKSENNIPVFIASGRLVEQKDYPTMLHAFSMLLKSTPAKLLILGDGDVKDALINTCKELNIHNDVSFEGFVDDPLEKIKKSDYFLITSAWEGFGNVIVEALLCGKYVIATDCRAGPSEILRDGEFGSLCPVGDVNAICDAMKDAIQKETDCNKQRQRALDFTVTKICDDYEVLFNLLCSSPKNKSAS